MRVHFGEFALDRDSRQLWRGAEELPLVPKAFDLLDLLVTQRPRPVSKERIRDRLWPKTFVSDSTLTSLVVDLRAVLDDDARKPRFIRTLHGLGYSFCGAVAEDVGADRAGHGVQLRLQWGDRVIALAEGENLLGRVEGVVAWIDSPSVSRRHARIVVAAGRAALEDLGSKNGTWLCGERLAAAARLADGDEIRLGRVRMNFRASAGRASTQTDAEP